MKTLPDFVKGLLIVPAFAISAAQSPTPAGHWEGTIALPATALAVRVDLSHAGATNWSGTIDIPVQGLRGFKLDPVTVDGSTVRFEMPGIPGAPRFDGKMSSDAKSIAGEFAQSGQRFTFKLERKAKTERAGETPSRGIPGKGIAGFWQASLKPSPVIELRLALEIANNAAGQPGGVMVSMDQGGARIPISGLTTTGDAVHLETKSVGGVFDGKMSADGSEISGEWKQGGRTLPLVFRRLAKAASLNRPQEPTPPFPYDEQEVVVENAKDGVKLAGTLTMPEGAGPHPGVALITGSGPQDRDEALMGHRPFLVLADHLTRQGIAVLRYDDRGVAKSTGKFGEATLTDFVQDACSAFAYLRSRKEIDPRRIGLIGHSEGGIVAPLVAAKTPEVGFIVLLAGVGVPTEELLVRQGRDIGLLMGLGQEATETNAALQRKVFEIVRTEKDSEQAAARLTQLLRESIPELTEEQRKAVGFSDSAVDAQVRTVLSPWFRGILEYDPRPTLKAVKCPVLAINGEKDIQVAAKENLAAIRSALEAGGNTHIATEELPGLNHLFQKCETGAVAEYATIEETMNPAALSLVSDWIRKTAGMN